MKHTITTSVKAGIGTGLSIVTALAVVKLGQAAMTCTSNLFKRKTDTRINGDGTVDEFTIEEEAH